MGDLNKNVPELADAISHHYLSHLQTSRQPPTREAQCTCDLATQLSLHTTKYLYTEPVSLCHNLVHLRPRLARGSCVTNRFFSCSQNRELAAPPRLLRQPDRAIHDPGAAQRS